jgi:PBP1b-binding outer membrane lipoprotein LpoB
MKTLFAAAIAALMLFFMGCSNQPVEPEPT